MLSLTHRLFLPLLCAASMLFAVQLGAARTGHAAALSADQRATVDRVEDYLNRLESLRSRFVQVNSFGAFAQGELHLVRPGQLRFEYDSPHPILMIADGSMLLFYNKKLQQASFVPLSKTPLRFLTDRTIDLTDSAEITAVDHGKASLSISLKDNSGGFEGSVILVFGDKPLELRRWQIIDEDGVVIEVALVNPEFGARVDGSVFDYSDLDIHKHREEGRDRGR